MLIYGAVLCGMWALLGVACLCPQPYLVCTGLWTREQLSVARANATEVAANAATAAQGPAPAVCKQPMGLPQAVVVAQSDEQAADPRDNAPCV
jgi:hypothetical protein